MLDRFRAGTLNQQIQIIVAGVCLMAFVLIAAWMAFFRISYQPLFTELRPSDASAIVADLERKKISYRLAEGGATILVPSEVVDSTRLSLTGDEAALRGAVGFELFNKSDMGLTDFAQKINYQRALQGELARTIMALDGVDNVRVHLSLGEDRIFRADQVAPKASVTVRMKKNAVLTEPAALGIKRLVAAAVPKMTAADVVVLNEQGQLVVTAEPQPSAEDADPVAAGRHAVEDFYKARIRETLLDAELPTSVAVSVRALVVGRQDLTEWNPAARSFPLQITLSPVAALQPEMQEQVRALAGKAVATAGHADIITFGALPVIDEPGMFSRRQAAEGARAMPSLILPAQEARSGMADWLMFGIPILVVLAAALLLLRQLRGSGRLSRQKQQDFADRLRAALNQGGSSAIPRP